MNIFNITHAIEANKPTSDIDSKFYQPQFIDLKDRRESVMFRTWMDIFIPFRDIFENYKRNMSIID